MSLDDPRPLETMRSFHEQWVESATKAGLPEIAKEHKAQLAYLKLAEKALANPSKRFSLALQKTMQVVAESERRRIDELGLSPVTAEGHLIDVGEVFRTGKPLPKLSEIQAEITAIQRKLDDVKTPVQERVELDKRLQELTEKREQRLAVREEGKRRPESFYSPFVSRKRSRAMEAAERAGFFGTRTGPYGVPVPRPLAELSHEFTGKSIIAGDIRIDAANLAGQSYGRTVRGVTVLNDYKKKVKSARDKPPTGSQRIFYRPIRTGEAGDISDRLRAVLSKVDEGTPSAEDLAALTAEEIEALNSHLYPGRRNQDGIWVLDEEIPGAKWWDIRTFPDDLERIPPSRGGWRKAAQVWWEVAGRPTIYLRPSYVYNTLSNKGMLVIEQGWFSPATYLGALFSRRIYGKRLTEAVDAFMGGSRSHSYVTEDMVLNKGGRALSEFWHTVTDLHDRRANFYYWAWRKGYRSKAEMERLVFDNSLIQELNEVKRRGNKGVVEMDNLSWAEQHHLRHLLFVYPWRSRQVVWSLRTIVEHPAKAAILEHIGEDVADEAPDVLKKVPAIFKRIGFVPIGMDEDGNPKVNQATALNTWSGLQDLMTLDVGQSLGPFGEFMVRGLSGRDEFGNQYPGSEAAQWGRAALDVLSGMPQVLALKRQGRFKHEPLPPVDITDRETLIDRLNAGLERTVLSPGWLNGYGMLLTGSMTTREMDRQAVIARWYKDQPPEVRHRIETELIRRALKLQSDFLNRPVPEEVSLSVDLYGKIQWKLKQVQAEHGWDEIPDAIQDHAFVDVLHAEKRMSDAEAKKAKAQIKGLLGESEHKRFRTSLFDRFAHGKALAEWDESVRLVASYANPEVMNHRLAKLADDGLTDQRTVKADRKTLTEVGRLVLGFEREVRRWRSELSTLKDDERAAAVAEMRVWEDEQDKPLVVNGVKVPSAVRLDWSDLTTAEKRKAMVENAAGTWENLTGFEKEMLGHKVGPKVAQGWADLERREAEYHHKYAAKPPHDEQYLAVLKYIDKEHPGFLKDWKFAQSPKWQRFITLKPYKQLPPKVRVQFANEVAANARIVTDILARPSRGDYYYDKTEVRAAWKTYVRDSLLPYLRTQPLMVGLLDEWGQEFFYSLINR